MSGPQRIARFGGLPAGHEIRFDYDPARHVRPNRIRLGTSRREGTGTAAVSPRPPRGASLARWRAVPGNAVLPVGWPSTASRSIAYQPDPAALPLRMRHHELP
ncbi:hypothetical protein [Alloactinosynnema sp. L-07]|nr:hypothetical protein [Alloactinosynnema sp. L-07]